MFRIFFNLMTKGYGRAWFTAQDLFSLAVDDLSLYLYHVSGVVLFLISLNRFFCLQAHFRVGFIEEIVPSPLLSAKFISRRSGRVLLHNGPAVPLRNLDGCPTAGRQRLSHSAV